MPQTAATWSLQSCITQGPGAAGSGGGRRQAAGGNKSTCQDMCPCKGCGTARMLAYSSACITSWAGQAALQALW